MTTSIIAQIFNGAVTVWDDVKADIEKDAAKIEAVLGGASSPGVAAVVTDIKQGASDALSTASAMVATYEPKFVTGLEALADAALSTYTGGLALPLVALTNEGIEKLSAAGASALQAWALKAKAALAENNTTTGAAQPPAAPATQ